MDFQPRTQEVPLNDIPSYEKQLKTQPEKKEAQFIGISEIVQPDDPELPREVPRSLHIIKHLELPSIIQSSEEDDFDENKKKGMNTVTFLFYTVAVLSCLVGVRMFT